jgi:uncharacterized protein YndB with AHSA1/START domain
MAQGLVAVTIARLPEDVFDVISNVELNSRWSSASVEGRLITPGPVALGSRAREVSRVFGRRVEVVSEIIEFEPGRLLGYRTAGGPFPFRGTFATDPLDSGTRLTATFDARLEGIARVADIPFGWLVRRQLGGDLTRLKRLLEEHKL